MSRFPMPRSGGRRGGSLKTRLLIAAVLVVISLFTYYSSSKRNPVTGEVQRVAMDEKQEIALGLQAMPQMVDRHGGEVTNHPAAQHVDQVGERLLNALNRTLQEAGYENPYPFEFHLLADDQTINAFALPGGQVFITVALYQQLETEGQLAGVLGHEIGHVLSRHGAQRLAKQKLTQGLTGAAGVAGGDASSAQMAAMIGNMINMKYGRQDELESDRWGVKISVAAGYDPLAMIGVMEILDRASKGGPPEMLSTHPKPANRVAYIKQVIDEQFPDGLPPDLRP